MSKSTTPPTPDGLPVLGHALAFSRHPFESLEEWAELGNVVRLRFPGQTGYLVTDPELIATVLHDSDGRFRLGQEQQERFATIEEDALQANRGERWERMRRAIQPAFARQHIDTYAGHVVDETERRLSTWEAGERFDLPREMQELTLQIVSRTLLDVDVSGREEVVLDAVDAFIDKTDPGRLGSFLPDPIPTPTDVRFRRTTSRLDEFIESALAERREAATDGQDVSGVLLDAQERGALTAAEVHDNLVGFLLAGTDTTAMAFTYLWYLLAEHPDEQEMLRAEYERAFDDGPPGSWRDLERTRAVVSEGLRLYPPAWAYVKQTTEPVTLGSYDIPEGADLLLSQWVLQRDDRYWDEPEQFRPGRWLEDVDRPEYAYFPFGGGRRHCIGMHYVMMELVVATATLVGNADLQLEMGGELEYRAALSLRPTTEMRASVRHR